MGGELGNYIKQISFSRFGKHYPTVTATYPSSQIIVYSMETGIDFAAAVLRYVNILLPPEHASQAARLELTNLLADKFTEFFDERER